MASITATVHAYWDAIRAREEAGHVWAAAHERTYVGSQADRLAGAGFDRAEQAETDATAELVAAIVRAGGRIVVDGDAYTVDGSGSPAWSVAA
jgi:hypothetical protein